MIETGHPEPGATSHHRTTHPTAVRSADQDRSGQFGAAGQDEAAFFR